MNNKREISMLIAANLLAKAPFDQLSEEDLSTMLKHGNITGAFVCGVRWADKNPESPWVHISERMPEDSLPELSTKERERQSVKVMILMKSGQVMEATRRISLDGKRYWNIPLRMREDITHWMPIPPVPAFNDDLNQE